MERIDILDKNIIDDPEYMQLRKQYHDILEELKKQLKGDDEKDIIMKLDALVGSYSSRYGELIYKLGFHDGLSIGLEHIESRG